MHLVSALASIALAQGYAHRTAPTSGGVDVTVYSLGSGRQVWKRTFPDVAIGWSKDRKAIAVLDQGFFLTIWRQKEKIRRYKIGPRPGGLGEPPSYRDSIRWSPDKQRVLMVIPGTMGDAMMDYGMLIVVRVASRVVEDVDLVYSQKKAEWTGNRTVKYWRQKQEKNGDFTVTGPHSRRVR